MASKKPAKKAAAKKQPAKTMTPAKASKKPKTAGKDMTKPGPKGSGSKAIPYQGTAPQAGGGTGMGGYGL